MSMVALIVLGACADPEHRPTLRRAIRRGDVPVLDLSNRGLRELPPAIGRAENLLELHLVGNQLRTLPREIGNLRQLETLIVAQNRLEALPREIGRLTALQNLYLMENEISEIPPEIGDLHALVDLFLAENCIRELPEEIGRLGRLETLEVGNNRLERLPDAIGQLHSLKHLSISGNPLRALPPGIANLTSLETLALVNTRLDSYEATLRQVAPLPRLRSLAMSQCGITSLPDEMPGFESLRVFRLRLNELTDLPAWVFQLPSLETILLEGNPFTPQDAREITARFAERGVRVIWDPSRPEWAPGRSP